MMRLAGSAPGQHPFVQQILTIQARQAAAAAAHAAGDAAGAVNEIEAAGAIEDAIDSLSQPPYPIVPVHELYGSMLMDMGRYAEARKQFEETLKRTPGRPKAIAGIARAAQAMGDTATARARSHAWWTCGRTPTPIDRSCRPRGDSCNRRADDRSGEFFSATLTDHARSIPQPARCTHARLAAAGALFRPRDGAAELASTQAPSGAAPGAGGSRLIVRNARPLDAEAPIEALRTFETPNDLFFVREITRSPWNPPRHGR